MPEKQPMNKLLILQQSFQSHILERDSDLFTFVTQTSDLSKTDRVELYAGGYVARLITALSANYPRLKEYTGEQVFERIATAYIKQYPSTTRSIRYFGDKLVIFLQEHYSRRPILAEFASFEWGIGKTFDSADSIISTADDLRAVPPADWAKLGLYFHPSLSHADYSYNILQIWEGLSNNERKRARRLKTPQAVLFWRYNLEMLYRPLSIEESSVLSAALQGKTFGELCEVLCQWLPEDQVGLQAATLLMRWVSDGLISSCST